MNRLSPYLVGLIIGLAAMVVAVSGGYAWGGHHDPEVGYCHFYPTVCAQNGGHPPVGMEN